MLDNRHEQADIVAIGTSAGGVQALCSLLSCFPPDLPAAVLVVLHRSPYSPSYLPEILSRHTRMKVRLAREGWPLEHGVCFVSPTSSHLTVGKSGHIHLVPDSFYRAHSVDVLFNSLAQWAGPRTIGVILTGMLKDGILGLKAIKEAGGVALVQSPSEAEYPEMPTSAIHLDGPIDLVGSLEALAENICARLDCTPVVGAK
jgi:two-component system chemotaxis response regulator CheB